LFAGDKAVVVCAGMGKEAARRATEAVLQRIRPELIVSAGFARVLTSDQRVAEIVVPAEVFEVATKESFPTLFGSGQLWTSFQVVEDSSPPAGIKLFDCRGVDMEAAGVAEVAAAHGVPFIAVKSISDEAHFKMPPVAQFIRPDGGFQTAAFLFHVGMRPRTWPGVVALAINSNLAAEKLCGALRSLIDSRTIQGFDLNVELARVGAEVAH